MAITDTSSKFAKHSPLLKPSNAKLSFEDPMAVMLAFKIQFNPTRSPLDWSSNVLSAMKLE